MILQSLLSGDMGSSPGTVTGGAQVSGLTTAQQNIITAYHGAAPLISAIPTGKTILGAAAAILAVEAYHAGLIRTTINFFL